MSPEFKPFFYLNFFKVISIISSYRCAALYFHIYFIYFIIYEIYIYVTVPPLGKPSVT